MEGGGRWSGRLPGVPRQGAAEAKVPNQGLQLSRLGVYPTFLHGTGVAQTGTNQKPLRLVGLESRPHRIHRKGDDSTGACNDEPT